MKNTFALSMTLLLALTLGGSILGYRIATTDEKPAAAESSNPGMTSQGGSASTSGSNTAAAPTEGSGKAVGAGGSTMNSGPATGTDSSATMPAGGTTTNTSTGNETGTPGNTNLQGTTSSNAADGSLAPSGPNAAQKGSQPAAAQGGNSASGATASVGDATKGKAVFASASCAGCHGANGEGGIGPNLHAADGPKAWTLDQFKTALRSGQSPQGPLKAPMPQFSPAVVSDDDVANIHAYIKTLN